MKKTIVIIATSILVAIMLAGCGQQFIPNQNYDHYSEHLLEEPEVDIEEEIPQDHAAQKPHVIKNVQSAEENGLNVCAANSKLDHRRNSMKKPGIHVEYNNRSNDQNERTEGYIPSKGISITSKQD